MKAKHIPPVQQLRIHLDEVVPKGGLELIAEDEAQLEELAPVIDKLARDPEEAELARAAVRMLARDEELPPANRLTKRSSCPSSGR